MSSIVQDLELANRRGVLVQFYRGGFAHGDEPYQGYVHQTSPELAVVQLLSDRLDLDGYGIFRIPDITTLELEYPKQEFHESALVAKGISPRAPATVDLSSLGTALRTIEASYSLFVVHRELEDPDVCEVGRLKFCSDESYTLRTMSASATWVDDARHYAFSSITQIGFDGEYENTLALVAKLAG